MPCELVPVVLDEPAHGEDRRAVAHDEKICFSGQLRDEDPDRALCFDHAVGRGKLDVVFALAKGGQDGRRKVLPTGEVIPGSRVLDPAGCLLRTGRGGSAGQSGGRRLRLSLV